MITPTDGLFLLWGVGATNRAVATALGRRGCEFIAVDDAPASDVQQAVAEAGGVLEPPPSDEDLAVLLSRCGAFLPTPGLADGHRAMRAARSAGIVILSEFDLAAAWDDRPVVAVTGTNGKTTVTTLVAEALGPSTGAVAAGNNDLPLVSAIDDPDPAVFVAEASSFRLGRSREFRPRVAAWLNFSPDHLDVHASVKAYEEAKAAIWRHLGADDVAILNDGDPVVAARRPVGSQLTFGTPASDATAAGGSLVLCGEPIVEIARLPRRFPHDLRNAEAVAACAVAAGAPAGDVRAALESFRGLPHRLELVARTDTNLWYDDSKATTPDAVLAATGAFKSVVLIAGGRNKGLDLQRLAGAASVRAVVAIGEAAGEVCSAFGGSRPVHRATDMERAVLTAGELALPGEAIVLSPGCTSFDWYDSYRHRGEHFAALVRTTVGMGEPR
ncbi:MAG: UDP-N-acetylmuramoyl-L-alanine--D-glutamate ligase [bacterium]|nr:UDP-N-acetylmuramoyl-L-alanine--D-glutamate ligase [bacterium]